MGMSVESTIKSAKDLEAIFNRLFTERFNTQLIGGVDEPEYIPADDVATHRLYYRQDYFSSALHETAHWCIAGEERRLRPDFGYWYNPDGRTGEQ